YMTDEQYAAMNKDGMSNYFNKLLEKDNEESNGLGNNLENLSNEIKAKFMNDPRRPYLLQQLITEFYFDGNNKDTLSSVKNNIEVSRDEIAISEIDEVDEEVCNDVVERLEKDELVVGSETDEVEILEVKGEVENDVIVNELPMDKPVVEEIKELVEKENIVQPKSFSNDAMSSLMKGNASNRMLGKLK
ncbi:MAG: hypothetical protein ACRDA5_02490, partial [Clostridium sp.]